MKSKLKKQELIKSLLDKYPHLKDNDMRLICNVWASEMKSQGVDPHQFRTLFLMLQNGTISNPESIRRGRAKLQEEFPEYRGEKYIDRHKEVSKWKQDLGYCKADRYGNDL